MPARACGTIRTVLATTATAKITSRMSTISAAGMVSPPCLAWFVVVRRRSVRPPWPGLGAELGDRVDQGRGALDLEDVDLCADRDHVVLVIGPGGPDLAAD